MNRNRNCHLLKASWLIDPGSESEADYIQIFFTKPKSCASHGIIPFFQPSFSAILQFIAVHLKGWFHHVHCNKWLCWCLFFYSYCYCNCLNTFVRTVYTAKSYWSILKACMLLFKVSMKWQLTCLWTTASDKANVCYKYKANGTYVNLCNVFVISIQSITPSQRSEKHLGRKRKANADGDSPGMAKPCMLWIISLDRTEKHLFLFKSRF